MIDINVYRIRVKNDSNPIYFNDNLKAYKECLMTALTESNMLQNKMFHRDTLTNHFLTFIEKTEKTIIVKIFTKTYRNDTDIKALLLFECLCSEQDLLRLLMTSKITNDNMHKELKIYLHKAKDVESLRYDDGIQYLL